jgi:hypothetical protein
MSFYYLGLKKKTIRNNQFFKKAIVLEGGAENDICYENIYKDKIDYNSNNIEDVKKMCQFFDMYIDEIRLKDCDSKFMMYNQFTIEYMKNSKYVQCVNDINLIKNLNNKIKCREILKNEATFLDYKYLQLKDINFKKINNFFDCQYRKYVVQQPIGFAGVGTFLLDDSNSILKYLKKDVTYSVSGYVEDSISLNNTFMISDNYIHIFDGSIQNIKVGKELEYDGWDFENYNKIDKSILLKIYTQTMKISKKLQSLGYRGIGGIDYLLKDDDVYFMEINPRFQVSSEQLDKFLIDKGLPSIFELNYWAFYDEEKFIKICNSIK